jgi:hypothetical protein
MQLGPLNRNMCVPGHKKSVTKMSVILGASATRLKVGKTSRLAVI